MAGFPIIAHHFKGDKKKALTLTGEARRFLHQVETYERQPYFKRTEKLIDGSTITVQRLENGQYLSFINTFIEEEILEEGEVAPEEVAQSDMPSAEDEDEEVDGKK